jgi:hypothetical protein
MLSYAGPEWALTKQWSQKSPKTLAEHCKSTFSIKIQLNPGPVTSDLVNPDPNSVQTNNKEKFKKIYPDI